MLLKIDDNDSKELDDKEKQIDSNTSSEDLKLAKTADKLSSPPRVPLRPTTGHNEEFDTDEEDLKDATTMMILWVLLSYLIIMTTHDEIYDDALSLYLERWRDSD